MRLLRLLSLFIIIILISFGTIGGCGGGDGDSSDEMIPADNEMPMDEMEEDMMEEESDQVVFIFGGTISRPPQTFPYVDGGGPRQSLDFYGIEGLSQAKDGLRPAILFVHGGFWLGGSKEDIDPFVFEVAEEVGFHVISIGFRLADDASAPWPDIIRDINTAIRWIKLNSDMLGIDPDALILAGPSSGGHLAALASTASDVQELQGTENPGPSTEVIATVVLFGVHDLNTLFTLEVASLFQSLNCDPLIAAAAVAAIFLLIDDCDVSINPLDPLEDCNQSRLDLTSPALHVDNSDPPMFLIHGTDDCNVPFLQSEEMADALDDAGVFNQFILVEGGMHDLESLNLTVEEIVDFLEIVFGIN